MARQRCLTVGCNPKLKSEAAATQHAGQTGHRTAKWPVRSAEGRRKQRERNRASDYITREDRMRPGEFVYTSGSFCEGEDGDDYWGDSDGGMR